MRANEGQTILIKPPPNAFISEVRNLDLVEVDFSLTEMSPNGWATIRDQELTPNVTKPELRNLREIFLRFSKEVDYMNTNDSKGNYILPVDLVAGPDAKDLIITRTDSNGHFEISNNPNDPIPVLAIFAQNYFPRFVLLTEENDIPPADSDHWKYDPVLYPSARILIRGNTHEEMNYSKPFIHVAGTEKPVWEYYVFCWYREKPDQLDFTYRYAYQRIRVYEQHIYVPANAEFDLRLDCKKNKFYESPAVQLKQGETLEIVVQPDHIKETTMSSLKNYFQGWFK